MSENHLDAQLRNDFGKGAARRARRDGVIPAVMYGHGSDTMHLGLPSHETFLIVRSNPNAVVELSVDGETYLTLVKDVQRHPVSRNILHVDLLAVKAGEKVDVEVPISVVGEPQAGLTHTVETFQVMVAAPATSIPEFIKVDIEGAEDGLVIHAGDLKLPENVDLVTDEEVDILSVAEIQENEIPEPEAAAEGESEGAEAAEAAEEASEEE